MRVGDLNRPRLWKRESRDVVFGRTKMADSAQPKQRKIEFETMGLYSLPTEILEAIFLEKSLDIIDIANLSGVCRRFNEICGSEIVWETKFQQRYPSMFEKVLLRNGSHENVNIDWEQEMKNRFSVGQYVEREVAKMEVKFYHVEILSSDQLGKLLSELGNGSCVRMYAIDALIQSINRRRKSGQQNFTISYYQRKLLAYLQKEQVSEDLRSFCKKNTQVLEKGALLVSQYFQPRKYLSPLKLSRKLDALAAEVIARLKDKHPDHPACQPNTDSSPLPGKAPRFALSGMRALVCGSDRWLPQDSLVILDAINTVLYQQRGFTGNKDDYYNFNNSLIDKVLRCGRGIPITLCVVYAAVARRLGVVLHPINFPGHMLLTWTQGRGEAERVWYVDVFSKGERLTLTEACTQMSVIPGDLTDSMTNPMSPKHVMVRMVRNLMARAHDDVRLRVAGASERLASITRAYLALKPDDHDARIQLATLSINNSADIAQVGPLLEQVLASRRHDLHGTANYLVHVARNFLETERHSEEERARIQPKFWIQNPDVLFKVGMVMRHKRYNYDCVITGWDPKCKAGQQWIVSNGVHTLPRKENQPFYNVLAGDGTERYAAQENLEPHPHPLHIPHRSLGRHFTRFLGAHYELNTAKRRHYPEDIIMTGADRNSPVTFFNSSDSDY